MLSLSRMKLALLAFGLGCAGFTHAAVQQVAAPALGKIAAEQTRHIATYFPGRMAGSPAELIAADYLQQYFAKLGYQSDLRGFDARYLYTSRDGKQSWHDVHSTAVIAARAGTVPQQIVVMAHFDTYLPQSDADSDHNLGGLTLQGVDDNASGVGVMLELAERLSKEPTHYSLRFVALSAEETGAQGAADYVQRMSPTEKLNTLLVVNLDSLIVGDKLYFKSGKNTSQAVTKLTRDRAVALARHAGIAAEAYSGKDCCNGMQALDDAHIPLLMVTATDYALGKKDGQQQRAISAHFPQGTSRHQGQLDNLQYLDRVLPGRIDKRSKDSVRILLPLLKELAKPADDL